MYTHCTLIISFNRLRYTVLKVLVPSSTLRHCRVTCYFIWYEIHLAIFKSLIEVLEYWGGAGTILVLSCPTVVHFKWFSGLPMEMWRPHSEPHSIQHLVPARNPPLVKNFPTSKRYTVRNVLWRKCYAVGIVPWRKRFVQKLFCKVNVMRHNVYFLCGRKRFEQETFVRWLTPEWLQKHENRKCNARKTGLKIELPRKL